MDKPKISVILGSIREGRIGGKVASWFMNTIEANTNAEVKLVDLRDFDLPLFSDATIPSDRVGPHPNPKVQKWLDTVAEADGYVIITPEYNHSFSSALKNAIDYCSKEWAGKPVGFVSYGGLVGGSRAVEQLRLVVGDFDMFDIRAQVIIRAVKTAFNEAGNLIDGERQAKSATALIDRLAELARKLSAKNIYDRHL